MITYKIYNNKDNETHYKNFNNYDTCYHWIINHLDLHKQWNIDYKVKRLVTETRKFEV